VIALCLLVTIGLTIYFVNLGTQDFVRFFNLLEEDRMAEWLSTHAFIGSAIVLFIVAIRKGRRERRLPWGYLGLLLLFIFTVGEEISWGQRIFGIITPGFFVENSSQAETNLHNVFQEQTGLLTRHLVALFCIAVGVVFPLLNRYTDWFKKLVERLSIPVPSMGLIVPFAIAAAASLEPFSAKDEEVGELVAALASFFWMLIEFLDEMNKPVIRIPELKFVPRAAAVAIFTLVLAGSIIYGLHSSRLKADAFDEEFGVVSINAEEFAAIQAAIPGPNNEVACAIFDVRGHGFRALALSDFQQCDPTTPLDVYCLNGEGQWVNDNLSQISIVPELNQVTFLSAQEGYCALLQDRPTSQQQ